MRESKMFEVQGRMKWNDMRSENDMKTSSY